VSRIHKVEPGAAAGLGLDEEHSVVLGTDRQMLRRPVVLRQNLVRQPSD
jgi:hypothetical protein